MEFVKISMAILFLMVSVFYVNDVASKIANDKKILLRMVVVFISTLLCLFIIDIVIFYDSPQLLRTETKDKILEMIKYLLIGIGALHFSNQKN